MEFIAPQWPAPANVRAVCTTRTGGVSRGAYASLNLGDHVGDDPQSVARNRMAVAEAIGARPVYMEQVHGVEVASLDVNSRDGGRADGCVTGERGIACTIMVADCLPVLFTTADGSRVGAAHAGWRGLCAGAIEATARALSSDASSVIAWLGPCIGPEAFEVGDEVKAAFVERNAQAEKHFRAFREGKWLADLPALARMRLGAIGIASIHGNDGTRAWCTVSNPSTFFSHRRDRVSGRFASLIWRD